MIFAKDLLLKGGAGLALCVAAGVGGVKLYGKMTTETLDTLTDKVGLSCTPSGGISATIGVNCIKKTGSENIKIKQENTTFEVSTITGGTIKVYKDESHSKGFKFSIENNDISGTSSNKLEQFETYEIEEEGGKYYLSRKTKSKGTIEKALALPSGCSLPENSESPNNSTSCEELDGEKIKAINFDSKKQGGATINDSGKASLTIKKITSTDGSFPFGYVFTLRPTQPLSIKESSNSSLKANVDVDFKIKRENGTNNISLERAWTLDTLAKKAGLKECAESSGKTTCKIDDTRLNIKHDSQKEEGKSKSTPSTGTSEGKIRILKDIAGHREGFKFAIEEGDIGINDSSTISKLEEFETYEIEEEGGKYYLSRKTKALKEIAKLLGTPESCNQLENDSSTCSNLTKETLKNIKFEGKPDNGEITITNESSGTSNISLKISRTSETNFPLGYRFTLSSDKDISIPQNGTPNTPISIKKKSDLDFKIKKNTSSSPTTLSLEKAWDINSLAGKINLKQCNQNSDSKCSFGEKINVYDNETNYVYEASISSGDNTKKLSYQEGQEGYNQGFKFTAEEDITVERGTTPTNVNAPIKIAKNDNSSISYEIKEMNLESGRKWYLVKKTSSQ